MYFFFNLNDPFRTESQIYLMRIVATEICILPRMSDLVLQYVCRAMVQRLHTDNIHVYMYIILWVGDFNVYCCGL